MDEREKRASCYVNGEMDTRRQEGWEKFTRQKVEGVRYRGGRSRNARRKGGLLSGKSQGLPASERGRPNGDSEAERRKTGGNDQVIFRREGLKTKKEDRGTVPETRQTKGSAEREGGGSATPPQDLQTKRQKRPARSDKKSNKKGKK